MFHLVSLSDEPNAPEPFVTNLCSYIWTVISNWVGIWIDWNSSDSHSSRGKTKHILILVWFISYRTLRSEFVWYFKISISMAIWTNTQELDLLCSGQIDDGWMVIWQDLTSAPPTPHTKLSCVSSCLCNRSTFSTSMEHILVNSSQR
jgi:hypothetical protein